MTDLIPETIVKLTQREFEVFTEYLTRQFSGVLYLCSVANESSSTPNRNDLTRSQRTMQTLRKMPELQKIRGIEWDPAMHGRKGGHREEANWDHVLEALRPQKMHCESNLDTWLRGCCGDVRENILWQLLRVADYLDMPDLIKRLCEIILNTIKACCDSQEFLQTFGIERHTPMNSEWDDVPNPGSFNFPFPFDHPGDYFWTKNVFTKLDYKHIVKVLWSEPRFRSVLHIPVDQNTDKMAKENINHILAVLKFATNAQLRDAQTEADTELEYGFEFSDERVLQDVKIRQELLQNKTCGYMMAACLAWGTKNPDRFDIHVLCQDSTLENLTEQLWTESSSTSQ
eukprot:CAMPEP_0184306510 /NCGR_PEP_ID=MMETSP1049-20130417/15489_1 /TAXON_ID=77928 /ORGANISM="Proteomonas sulcata, Strain CCMP704" /LENGTH=341 /DNA_ID=CAMNT_0026618789 /DNA_START=193 /DNA_END=1218 /DNA_ORIENTATION=+